MSALTAQRGRRGNLPPQSLPWPNGTRDAIVRTGASERQLNYWAAHGLLGPHHANLGSGGRRTFTGADLEVVWGLARLADLGATNAFLEPAADAIRARRVDEPGELLIVRLDRACQRRQLGAFVAIDEPSWAVPLLTFADNRELREHAVPCRWCTRDAWAADAICDTPACRIRQAKANWVAVNR